VPIRARQDLIRSPPRATDVSCSAQLKSPHALRRDGGGLRAPSPGAASAADSGRITHTLSAGSTSALIRRWNRVRMLQNGARRARVASRHGAGPAMNRVRSPGRSEYELARYFSEAGVAGMWRFTAATST
jgi:hypothetical protein